MAFWAQPGIEPKRAYRFILSIAGFEQWVIKKVTRPSWDVSEVEHSYINHKFWYPGRVTWNPVTFTVVDPVKPDSTVMLRSMLYAQGYRLPLQDTTLSTVSKGAAVDAIGQVLIQTLGPRTTAAKPDGAQVLDEWGLVNPWVQNVTMGEHSYDDDSIMQMDITLRYDFATFKLGSGADPTAGANDRLPSADDPVVNDVRTKGGWGNIQGNGTTD